MVEQVGWRVDQRQGGEESGRHGRLRLAGALGIALAGQVKEIGPLGIGKAQHAGEP